MPTRRKVLLAAAGFGVATAAAGLAAGCGEGKRSIPQSPESSRAPRTLDLSGLRDVVLRPNDVRDAARAVVRIWAEDKKRGPRTVTTGVRVQRSELVLASETFRRQPEDGEIILHDPRIQVAVDAGELAVRQATRLALIDSWNTVLFEIGNPPDENISKILTDDPFTLKPGQVLHTAGYVPAGPRNAAVSFGVKAPQTGFKMAFLHAFAGQAHAFMSPKFKASEGVQKAERPYPGDAVFTEQGLLLGSVTNAQPVTVGQIKGEDTRHQYGSFAQVVDGATDVPPETAGWVVDCRIVDDYLMRDLTKNLADLPKG